MAQAMGEAISSEGGVQRARIVAFRLLGINYYHSFYTAIEIGVICSSC